MGSSDFEKVADLDRRHADDGGRPRCGAEAEGSLLVDSWLDITCVACLGRLAVDLHSTAGATS